MGPFGFGALQSVASIGALTGGLTLASRGDVPHKGKLMIAAGVIYGILLMTMGGLPWPIMAFLVMILAGASQTVFRACNRATLLEITPAQFQGRVISLNSLVIGLFPLGALLAGAVTDAIDVSMGMTVLGAICMLIVVAVALFEPRIRRL